MNNMLDPIKEKEMKSLKIQLRSLERQMEEQKKETPPLYDKTYPKYYMPFANPPTYPMIGTNSLFEPVSSPFMFSTTALMFSSTLSAPF